MCDTHRPSFICVDDLPLQTMYSFTVNFGFEETSETSLSGVRGCIQLRVEYDEVPEPDLLGGRKIH